MSIQTMPNTISPYFTYAPLCVAQMQAAAPLQGGQPPYAQTVTALGACTLLELCGGARQQFAAPAMAAQAVHPQGTFTPIGCTIGQFCGQAAAQVQAVHPQGTFTPIGCTFGPFCGQAVPQAQQAYFTVTPICSQQAAGAAAPVQGGAGVQPQATLGPIQCNITVYTLCTPVCGQ